jgi:hypothetical protein
MADAGDAVNVLPVVGADLTSVIVRLRLAVVPADISEIDGLGEAVEFL